MALVALFGLVVIDVSEVTVWLPRAGDVAWVATFRSLFAVALVYGMGFLWSMEGVRRWLGRLAAQPLVVVLSALSYSTLMGAPFIIWALVRAIPMSDPEPFQVGVVRARGVEGRDGWRSGVYVQVSMPPVPCPV
jgi:hypothetical protein